MNNFDVTVIIVNYNTRQLLLNCLKSIYEQTQEITFEVIVVDNASVDGSVEAVTQAFPQVHLMANRKNLGFAAANNQGIRSSGGRYILLLNPDTVVLDRAIDKTVHFADHNPDVAVVGCQVLENEATIQQTCFAFPSVLNLALATTGLNRLFPHSRFFARPNMGWWDRDTQRDVDVVSGMFFLVRRDAVQRVGLMDEDYFVFAEEADWCFRFHRAGWRCVFAPVAKIIHLDGGGKSTSQVNVKMYVQLQKSLLIFFRKHRGLAAFFAAKVIYIFMMAVRAIAWQVCAFCQSDPKPRIKLAQVTAALRYHLAGREPET